MDFKHDRESTNGLLTFIEVMFRRGEEPPVHVHQQLDTKKMAAALAKFSMEVLGPPPSLSR